MWNVPLLRSSRVAALEAALFFLWSGRGHSNKTFTARLDALSRSVQGQCREKGVTVDATRPRFSPTGLAENWLGRPTRNKIPLLLLLLLPPTPSRAVWKRADSILPIQEPVR